MSATSQPKAAITIRRDDELVMLDGVPPFTVQTMQATPIACLSLVMRAVGEDVSYQWLMGVSGHAFRFQLSKGFAPKSDGWCGSSPHPCCGYDTCKPAMAALPYEAVDYPCMDKKPADVHAARAAVVASIDAGIPAIASSEECSLVVGYDNGGVALFTRQTWDDPKKPPQRWTGTPWGFWVLKPRTAKPDRAALVKASLKQAVEIATLTETGANPLKPNSGYDAGLPAMRRWVKELRDDKVWDAMDADSIKRVAQFNSWIYVGLCDARASAGGYLKEVAPQFAQAQRAHILAAAELYGQQAKTLMDTCPLDVAPGPWALKPGKTWDNALRHRQADLLEKAIGYEEKAIAELKAAAK